VLLILEAWWKPAAWAQQLVVIQGLAQVSRKQVSQKLVRVSPVAVFWMIQTERPKAATNPERHRKFPQQ
jgi:hypothetical protein